MDLFFLRNESAPKERLALRGQAGYSGRVRPELLDLLASPCCAKPLRVDGEKALACPCGRGFPVTRGVPELYLPETGDACLEENLRTWDFIWRKTAGFAGHFTSERMFRDDFALEEGALRGRVVLEAGIGPGKFLPYLLDSDAALVVGADISSGIFDVQEAMRGRPGAGRLLLVRCDLRRLPFRAGAFDLVLSSRVLHHIDAMEARMRELTGLLREGGEFRAVVYGRQPGRDRFIRWTEAVKPLLRRALGLRALFYASALPSLLVYAAARSYALTERWPCADRLPLRQVMLYWSRLSFQELWRFIIFDILASPKTRYLSRAELEEMLRGIPSARATVESQHEAMWRVRVQAPR